LAFYSKSLSNVEVLTADNCNTNRKISNLAIPLLGCASHQFILAVNKWISDHPRYCQMLEKIHGFMCSMLDYRKYAMKNYDLYFKAFCILSCAVLELLSRDVLELLSRDV
jgi:hypothetical protein